MKTSKDGQISAASSLGRVDAMQRDQGEPMDLTELRNLAREDERAAIARRSEHRIVGFTTQC